MRDTKLCRGAGVQGCKGAGEQGSVFFFTPAPPHLCTLAHESGQTLVLTAFLGGVLILFVLYLLINVGGWYRDVRLLDQAAQRAARDGTTALSYSGSSLALQPVPDPDNLPPAPASHHCLDLERAKGVARAALARNLRPLQRKFIAPDGTPLSAAAIAADTTGTYLVLAAGNPPGLGCSAGGDPHPAGETFSRPWVYIQTTIPVKAFLGAATLTRFSETTATSALSPRGGARP